MAHAHLISQIEEVRLSMWLGHLDRQQRTAGLTCSPAGKSILQCFYGSIVVSKWRDCEENIAWSAILIRLITPAATLPNHGARRMQISLFCGSYHRLIRTTLRSLARAKMLTVLLRFGQPVTTTQIRTQSAMSSHWHSVPMYTRKARMPRNIGVRIPAASASGRTWLLGPLRRRAWCLDVPLGSREAHHCDRTATFAKVVSRERHMAKHHWLSAV